MAKMANFYILSLPPLQKKTPYTRGDPGSLAAMVLPPLTPPALGSSAPTLATPAAPGSLASWAAILQPTLLQPALGWDPWPPRTTPVPSSPFSSAPSNRQWSRLPC